jgi:DNA replication protein DnaD
MPKDLKLTDLQERVIRILAKYHLREVNSYLALVIHKGLEELHSEQIEYAPLHNTFYGLTEHNKITKGGHLNDGEEYRASHEDQDDLIREIEKEMLAMFGYKNEPVQHSSCPSLKCPVIKDLEVKNV